MYNQLQTARLTLRRWKESDVLPFVEMNQDPEVMKYFPERPDTSATVGMIKRIERSFEKNHFGLFVVELNSSKEFLGFTGFWTPQFISNFTPCIEIGWRFRREFWNRGFATEAALACLELGFQKLKRWRDKIRFPTSDCNCNFYWSLSFELLLLLLLLLIPNLHFEWERREWVCKAVKTT